MAKADIKLGYSCNNDCVHCVIADHRDMVFKKGLPEDIPAETYRQELKDSRARADMVVFTGGEPTIRPELIDLLAYARDLGFTIMMQTNGRRLSRMSFAQAVCAIAPIHFTIALHGPNAEIHDAVTRKPGSFYETVQGIRNIIEIGKNGKNIGGKLVISKINGPHILETIRFMINLGIRSISLTFPHACGNARKDFFNVVPRYSEIREQCLEAFFLCFIHDVTLKTEALPFCLFPGYEFVVGELLMMDEEYSELKQYGCEEVVNWEQLRPAIKSKGPRCAECRFDKICEGPWQEYPRNYGFDELVPVPGEPVCCVEDVLKNLHQPSFHHSRAFSSRLDI